PRELAGVRYDPSWRGEHGGEKDEGGAKAAHAQEEAVCRSRIAGGKPPRDGGGRPLRRGEGADPCHPGMWGYAPRQLSRAPRRDVAMPCRAARREGRPDAVSTRSVGGARRASDAGHRQGGAFSRSHHRRARRGSLLDAEWSSSTGGIAPARRKERDG